MELKKYLESRRLSQAEFAKMLRISKGALCNYIHYRRLPTLEIGKRIETLTNGLVTIEDQISFWRQNNPS